MWKIKQCYAGLSSTFSPPPSQKISLNIQHSNTPPSFVQLNLCADAYMTCNQKKLFLFITFRHKIKEKTATVKSFVRKARQLIMSAATQ